jgi:hypothetical protein
MSENTIIVSKSRIVDNFEETEYRVILKWSLKFKPKGLCFSGSGTIYNHLGEMVSGGQNIDEIAQLLPNNGFVQRFAEIHSEWHLNDLTPGTEKQMEFINKYVKLAYEKSNSELSFYEFAVKKLKEIGLLIDDGYKYGTAWLFRKIPDKIVEEIKSWKSKGLEGSSKKTVYEELADKVDIRKVSYDRGTKYRLHIKNKETGEVEFFPWHQGSQVGKLSGADYIQALLYDANTDEDRIDELGYDYKEGMKILEKCKKIKQKMENLKIYVEM